VFDAAWRDNQALARPFEWQVAGDKLPVEVAWNPTWCLGVERRLPFGPVSEGGAHSRGLPRGRGRPAFFRGRGSCRQALRPLQYQVLSTPCFAIESESLARSFSTESSKRGGLEIAFSAFLLIAVGRVGELIPGLGALPLARVAMGVGVVILFVRWKQLPKIAPSAMPILRAGLALTVLAALTAPFSIWLGQSVGFLFQQLPVLAATVIVGSKLSSDWWELRRVVQAVILSGVALAATAVAGFHGERASSGMTYDTNDLAYLLVSVLPLMLAFLLNSKTLKRRVLSAGVLGVVVIALLLTSSRGGFLGLLAVLSALIVMQIRPPKPRPDATKSRNRVFPTLIGVLAVSALIWPYLPEATRSRLETIVELGNDYNMDTENEHSRSSIWERNFSASLRRPIGYGVGSFPMVDIRNGGRFMAPHNSYLQILVELGFLGLFFFLRLYFLCWRALKQARSSLLSLPATDERDQMVVLARMLQISLIGNAVAGFFLSMAYSIILWTLVAVVVGCVSLVSTAVVAQGPRPLPAA
jgi:O-antigen ligase